MPQRVRRALEWSRVEKAETHLGAPLIRRAIKKPFALQVDGLDIDARPRGARGGFQLVYIGKERHRHWAGQSPRLDHGEPGHGSRNGRCVAGSRFAHHKPANRREARAASMLICELILSLRGQFLRTKAAEPFSARTTRSSRQLPCCSRPQDAAAAKGGVFPKFIFFSLSPGSEGRHPNVFTWSKLLRFSTP